jgi:hypothetical protein
MPLSDKLRIGQNIHNGSHGVDWGSLEMSLSWGCSAGDQGASSRKFVYADLNLSRGFGPEKDGPRSCCLLLVFRKGDAHKEDRSNTDKQVGVWWQHKYLLCSVFNTALHVINDLSTYTATNFYHLDKKVHAGWWDKPLTGVESCKLTQNKTHAVQLGGISAWDELRNFQGCGIFWKGQAILSRSSNVQHPVGVPVLTDYLLPNYWMWCNQSNLAVGDKSSCCRKFLNQVLPFLVEVLVQDGIYLVREFPNHPMSNYLRDGSWEK